MPAETRVVHPPVTVPQKELEVRMRKIAREKRRVEEAHMILRLIVDKTVLVWFNNQFSLGGKLALQEMERPKQNLQDDFFTLRARGVKIPAFTVRDVKSIEFRTWGSPRATIILKQQREPNFAD